jgi:hypothetical protein
MKDLLAWMHEHKTSSLAVVQAAFVIAYFLKLIDAAQLAGIVGVISGLQGLTIGVPIASNAYNKVMDTKLGPPTIPPAILFFLIPILSLSLLCGGCITFNTETGEQANLSAGTNLGIVIARQEAVIADYHGRAITQIDTLRQQQRLAVIQDLIALKGDPAKTTAKMQALYEREDKNTLLTNNENSNYDTSQSDLAAAKKIIAEVTADTESRLKFTKDQVEYLKLWKEKLNASGNTGTGGVPGLSPVGSGGGAVVPSP